MLQTSDAPNLLAKEELNLLARLMGSMKAENKTKVEAGFQINLFTTDQEEEEAWVFVLAHFLRGVELILFPQTWLFLVNRGDPSGAEDSMSGVINIQAMQVQWHNTADCF